MQTIPFRRLPNGVLMRTVPVGFVDPEPRTRILSEEEKTRRAEERKAARLNEKRLKKIGYEAYDFNVSKKAEREQAKVLSLVKKDIAGSFENYDITDYRRIVTRDNGVRVAGVSVRVLYTVSGADYGLDEGEETEDSIIYIVYRDSEKPDTLRIRYLETLA